MFEAVVKRQRLSVGPPQGLTPHFQAHLDDVTGGNVEAYVEPQPTVGGTAVRAHLDLM